LGSSNPDKDGLVNYKVFAGKIKDMIDSIFDLVKMQKVANLVSAGTIRMD
jgi:hypothetical protein